MLKWKNLIEFQAVANLGNLSRASEHLYIAQPALTRTIHSLEDELKVTLFSRSKNGMCLNGNGKIVLDYVEKINYLHRRMLEELECRNQRPAPTVRLLAQVALDDMANVLTVFHQAHPDIFLECALNDIPLVQQTKEFDFIINGPSRASGQEFSQVAFLSERLCLAVSRDHPLAERNFVSLADIASEPLILTQCGADLRLQIEKYCHDAGFVPKSTMISDHYRTILPLIRAHLGISIVPQYSWGYQSYPDIRLIPISEPPCRRTLLLYWKKEKPLSAEAECFRDFLLEYYRSAVGLYAP